MTDFYFLFIMLPLFSFQLKHYRLLVFVLVYIFIKGFFLQIYNSSYNAFILDLYTWFLKPLVFFWSFYFYFLSLSKSALENFERILKYIVVIGIFYGFTQMTFWLLFKIDLPMRNNLALIADSSSDGIKSSASR